MLAHPRARAVGILRREVGHDLLPGLRALFYKLRDDEHEKAYDGKGNGEQSHDGGDGPAQPALLPLADERVEQVGQCERGQDGNQRYAPKYVEQVENE